MLIVVSKNATNQTSNSNLAGTSWPSSKMPPMTSRLCSYFSIEKPVDDTWFTTLHRTLHNAAFTHAAAPVTVNRFEIWRLGLFIFCFRNVRIRHGMNTMWLGQRDAGSGRLPSRWHPPSFKPIYSAKGRRSHIFKAASPFFWPVCFFAIYKLLFEVSPHPLLAQC